MRSVLALALAAVAATAQPLARAPAAQQVHLSMTVAGANFSLVAVDNGAGNKVLLSERKSVSPGTPAYFNSTDTPDAAYSALQFFLPEGTYGAIVPEVGDAYGVAEAVFAAQNDEQFEWIASNGVVGHKLQAALNSFYACYDDIAGTEPGYFLKWGTPNTNGTPPANCEATEVYYQEFSA